MNLLALALFSSIGLLTLAITFGIALHQELAAGRRRLRWAEPGRRPPGEPREAPLSGPVREPGRALRDPRPLLCFERDRL